MSKMINVEIRGVSFVNKGAELMLRAVKEQLEKKYPKVKIVMELNLGRGLSKAKEPFGKITDNGLAVKVIGRRYKINIPPLLNFLPKSILEKYSIVLEKDIDVILDASGFAFGDQWGVDFAKRRLTTDLIRWKAGGKKVILLSQAFGPFTKPGMKDEMAKIINYSDLVFARDQISFDYLSNVINGNSTKKVVLKPDFTNLIKGVLPADFDLTKYQVAIIPNFKMLVTNNESEGENYYSLLESSIKFIQSKGYKPFFLMHEGKKDEDIANHINSKLETSIPVVWESDPVKIKGIIGNVYAVITSRFHGLVSALSQGTPCLATSWSHKYEMLLKDYNYVEGLMGLDENQTSIQNKISNLLDLENNTRVRVSLDENAKAQKELSNEMWDMVFQEIDNLNN